LCKCFANVIPLLQLKNTGKYILDGQAERQAQQKFKEEEILWHFIVKTKQRVQEEFQSIQNSQS
jgi:hypothetical protein